MRKLMRCYFKCGLICGLIGIILMAIQGVTPIHMAGAAIGCLSAIAGLKLNA